MSESNARLNVLISLKSAVQGGEQALAWVTKYGAAIATTAASMAVFAAKQGIELGSRITDLSNQAEIGTEAFQVLSAAAMDSGVSMEEVSKSAVKLRQNIQSAREGNQAMVTSLQTLNLTAAGLQALAPERQWEMIAQRIAQATDRQAALNAASDLFGAKNAPKLMETLKRLGVEGYDKLAESTKDLRLDSAQLQTLDDAGDKLGVIVAHLKYIAAKGTVKVIDAGSAMLDRTKIAGNHNSGMSAEEMDASMAASGVENAADLLPNARKAFEGPSLAEATAALAQKKAATAAAEAAAAAQKKAAQEQAMAAAEQKALDETASKWVAEKNKKEEESVGQVAGALIKKQIAIDEAARAQAQYVVAAKATEQVEAKRLQQMAAEQALSRTIASSQQAIAAVESSLLISNAEKDRLRIPLLQAQNSEIQKRIDLLEQENALSSDPAASQLRQGRIDQLRGQQAGNTVAISNAQPMTLGQGAQMGMSETINQFGTDAQIVAGGIQASFQGAFQGISTSLQGLISGTMTWADALRNIGSTIMNSIIGAIADMFAKWLVGRAAQFAATIAFGKAEATATIANEASTLPIKTAGAAAAGISSYGFAVLGGVAALALIASLAFKDGGPVSGPGTGTSDSIPAWLSNGEYVMPAAETAKYRPLLDSMRAGTLNPGQLVTAGPSVGGAASAGSNTQINIGLMGNMSPQQWASSQEGESHILDVVSRNIHKVTGTG